MKSVDGRFQYWTLDHANVPDGSPPEAAHRLAYRCRSHPTNWCSVNLRGRGHDIEKRSWSWDGNVDRPTLAPSINCEGCWHGFIEEGEYRDTNHVREEKQ